MGLITLASTIIPTDRPESRPGGRPKAGVKAAFNGSLEAIIASEDWEPEIRFVKFNMNLLRESQGVYGFRTSWEVKLNGSHPSRVLYGDRFWSIYNRPYNPKTQPFEHRVSNLCSTAWVLGVRRLQGEIQGASSLSAHERIALAEEAEIWNRMPWR
jgi:hypothetical protein